MVQQGRPFFATQASPITVLTGILVALVLIQLPLSVPENAAELGQSLLVLSPIWKED